MQPAERQMYLHRETLETYELKISKTSSLVLVTKNA